MGKTVARVLATVAFLVVVVVLAYSCLGDGGGGTDGKTTEVTNGERTTEETTQQPEIKEKTEITSPEITEVPKTGGMKGL